MTQTQQILALAGAAFGLAGTVYGFVRYWLPKWRKFTASAHLWWATQVGAEAITHPVTGDIIHPEQKGVAHRLYAVEQGQERFAELMERVLVLMEGDKAQNARIDKVEARVTILEAASVERTVVRAESAALLNLAAQEYASPPPDLD